MKLYYLPLILLVLLNLTSCAWVKTGKLHSESYKRDTFPRKYITACLVERDIYVNYIPRPAIYSNQSILSETYWAKTTLDIVEEKDETSPQWVIFRKGKPSNLGNGQCNNIKNVDITKLIDSPDKKYKNRDKYITWIVDTNNYNLPVMLVDYGYTDGNHIYLLSSNKLYGKYRGLRNEPGRDGYRDTEIVLKNSWKYPFYVLGDILFQPIYWSLGG